MAEIVLGLGTSHSPLLSVPADLWGVYGERDQRNPFLYRVPDGKHVTYEALLAEVDPAIAKEITPEVFAARHAANQAGIAKVSEMLAKVNPDVLIMFGDDQQEVFSADFMPALCIFWGETVPFGRRVPAAADQAMQAARRWYGDGTIEHFPVNAALGRHLVEHLNAKSFDVTHARTIGEGTSISHAFGFVWKRIMGDTILPTVPVHINTYFPPNQPTPQRCWELGRAIREAVESWDSSARVAVLASGGFSHFVVDEDIDQQALKALRDQDVAAVAALPLERLQSGTSEIRNWFAAAGAVEHLDWHLIDYVPCYRSPAGTGCAMAFAYWS